MNLSINSCLIRQLMVIWMTLSETIHYVCCINYYFILCDIKDAVHGGNGDRLVTLHKLLLLHFKSIPEFNTYAVEMLISVVQNMAFLSPAQAHQ